jgi:hypothetical protein
MYVGSNEETVDFDGKHLGKRLRNTIISKQFQIGSTVLTRKDIEAILSLTQTNKHGVEQLVNPADKQNVSLATDLLSTFSKAVKMPALASCGFRVCSVIPVLKLLGYVMEGILAFYSYVTLGVEEQLRHISAAAHALLVMKKVYGTILPNQLYHDLMATFQNVIFCAAKFQIHHPLLPFFIVLLGSDVAEQVFGNFRLKYGHNGLDALELLHCARAMKEMCRIFNLHPDWTNKSSKVMSRLSLDYSKPTNWQVDKLTMVNVNIKQCWDQGRLDVESFAMEVKTDKNLADVDFFKWFAEGVTMLKPNGQKVGVTELEMDWSCEDLNENDTTQAQEDHPSTSSQPPLVIETDAHDEHNNEGDESNESASLIDNLEEESATGKKSDPQVSVNGTWFHKSTILKQTFIGRKASRDRLRRVQGLSKTIAEKKKDQLMNLDDVLFPGDPVLYVQNDSPKLASVVKITKGRKKVKLLNGNELQDDNISLTVKQLKLEDTGTVLEWTGEHSTNAELVISGKSCHSIQPEVEVREENAVYIFDKSLVFDLGITLNQSTSDPAATTNSTSNDASLKKCFLCAQMITLEYMKIHVGKHILKGDCETRAPCGYCGRGCCDNKLAAPNRRGKELFYVKVQSNCPYYVHAARRVQKSSTKNPCTNYMNKCQQCKADVWFYNLKNHYEDMHPDCVDVPDVDSDEVEIMNKVKSKKSTKTR